MHPDQEKLARLASDNSLNGKSLREIGELIGETHPQKVKHHLQQLEQKGLIEIDREKGIIRRVTSEMKSSSSLISIPILGSADCGPASVFAEESIQGYLKISARLLKAKSGLFALKAVGSSMNRSSIQGKNIEDGDYVIIDSEHISPETNDYVLSIIDGVCNIKRIVIDQENHLILLLSESSIDLPPIVIHPEEIQYFVNGKVIEVIKRSNQRGGNH